jgi:hypothetical protein
MAALIADRACSHVIVEPDWVPDHATGGLTAFVRLEAKAQTIGEWLFRGMARFYDAWRMTWIDRSVSAGGASKPVARGLFGISVTRLPKQRRAT